MQLNLDLARFLKRHWQKRPLLIRGAFEGFEAPIDGDGLAGIAAEPDAMARLVSHDRRRRQWSLQHGPFGAADYAALGDRDWTLLVQDVDKWLPEVLAPLLAQFNFLPSWRIEDVMVSFAVPGGSVGAHIDQYDVFLLQASGRRHWLIDESEQPPLELDARAPLKLLKRFKHTSDWVLEPGDVLYLPPGVPHHGVAVDTCMTFSVGFRAPSAVELLQAVAAELVDTQVDGARYRDPPLGQVQLPGQIDGAAIKRVRRTLKRALKSMNDQQLAACFGRFMSTYRAPCDAQVLARPPSLPAIGKRLAAGAKLCADSWQRLNWTAYEDGALLHGCGISAALPVPLAVQLCAGEALDEQLWSTCSSATQRALQQLLTAGALQLRRP